jgi:hypothetical protein
MTPCNIKASEADLVKTKAILVSTDNYLVRYLRAHPTVGFGRIPVRDEHGAVLPDMDPAHKRVICAGIPFGCMVAFTYDSKLLIGWSKRLETKQLIDSSELHTLFNTLLQEDNLSDEGEYHAAFDIFTQRLMDILTFQPAKDIEKAFSKVDGKTAAILRGLNDTIAVPQKGNLLTSAASGPIPHEVAKNLRWFIGQAEQAYGGKAANVSYANQEVAIIDKGSSLPTVT